MAVTDDFSSSELDLNGFVSISLATSLVWGPDGRLYVTQQFGEVFALDVTFGDKNPNDGDTTSNFYVSGAEEIGLIKSIPNHNDSGTDSGSNARQVTGIDAVQQFDAGGNPVTINGKPAVVMYVTSSDSRIGAGEDGDDIGLDTNSGVITRLTQTATGWDAVDIVRGLPRSEENHATNGLEVIQEFNGSGQLVSERVIVASGGNANTGAPSNNFAGQQETPLSGALLEIDLDEIRAIEANDGVKTDDGRVYVYDIPTLDDPTRAGVEATQDPFGGNDGLNSAKLLDGGPVQIYSAGYRNPYDVEVTDDGRVFTYDNGANNVWGGRPAGEDQNGDNLAFNDGPGTPAGYIATNLFVEDNLEITSDTTDGEGLTSNFNPQNWDQLHEATRSDDLAGRVLSSGLGGAQTYQWDHPDFAQPLTLVYGGHPNPTRAEGARAGLLYTPDGGVENAKLMVSNEDKGGGASDFLEVVAWLDSIGYTDAFINSTVVAVEPGVLYEDTFAGGFGGAGANGRPTTAGVYSLVPNASGPIGIPSDINSIVESLNPIEGNYLEAGFKDGAIDTGKGSINGLAEFTSSIFDDAGQTGMQGALLAASLNQGQLYVIGRDTNGVVQTTTTTEGNQGGSANAGGGNNPRTIAADRDFIAAGGAPLGLATLGDDLSQLGNQTAFRGTIWASIFKQNGPVIEVFQPGNPTTNPLLGALNYAGQAAGSPDDQDNDGVDFINDPFDFDADNGFNIAAGEEVVLNFSQNALAEYPEFSGTIGDTGLMGAALDGVTPNRDAKTAADGFPANEQEDGLFDNGGNLIPGGNAPIFQIKDVQDGTAVGAANTLLDAVHTGVKLANNVTGISAEADIANWWLSQPGGGRISGISFGDGTQENFVRFVWGDVNNNGALGLEVGIETNDVYTELAAITDAAFTSALTAAGSDSDRVTLRLEIDDIGGTYELIAQYKIEGDPAFTTIDLGGATLPAGVLQDVLDGTHTISDADTTLSSGAAFGFMAEKANGQSFVAVDYDELRINATGDGSDTILYRVNAGNSDVVAIDGGPNWIADASFVGASTGDITFTGFAGNTFTNELTDEASEVEFNNGAVSADAAVAPAALFFEDRNKGNDIIYNFAVEAGKDYKITVYYAENFQNIFTTDPRIIDIAVEGGVPAAFNDINPLAEAIAIEGTPPAFSSTNDPAKGPYLGRASQREVTYTATDDVLTLSFGKGGDGTGNNTKVNAIQIIEISDGPPGPDTTAPVISSIVVEDSPSDQDSPRLVTVTVTDETGLNLAGFAGLNGTELSFTNITPASVSAPQVTLSNGNQTATLIYTINPPSDTGAWPVGNFSVSMAAGAIADAAGNSNVASGFSFTFGGSQPGEVVLAVNVGGGEVDGAGYGLPGVTFEEDTSTNPHPTVDFSNATKPGDGNSTNNAGSGDPFTGVNLPDDVFTSERAGDDFSYNVDLPNGTYFVDLYFAETFFGVSPNTKGVGTRVFDATIEGTTVLNDYDIIDDGDGTLGNGAGAPLVRIVKSFEATVNDGTLTIRLDSVEDQPGEIAANNAKLSAFVIREATFTIGTDSVNGVTVTDGDFSDNGLDPTDLGTLEQGVTTVVASQQGDSAPGGRERDYFTFTVAEGQELTGIILEDWDTQEGGTPQAFVGIQLGDEVSVNPDTFENVGDLLGGHVYNAGDIENPATAQDGNLLSRDALGKGSETGPGGTFTFGDGSGFDAPLPAGTYTLWLNQGGDISTATLRIVTAALAVPGTVRIQAEDFDSSNTFAAVDNAFADGGEVAALPKFGFSGSATYDLSGTVDPGTYTVRVVYFDENDGESILGLNVTSDGEADFSDVVRLDETTGSNQATGSTLRTAEFADVEIGANGQLTLKGLTVGSETATVDYFEFIPQDGGNAGPAQFVAADTLAGAQFGPTAPASDTDTASFAPAQAGPENAIRIQAENHDMNNAFAAKSIDVADGGQVIGLAKFGASGTATYDLSGQVAPGLYTLRVVYFDENDGNSLISLNVTSDGQDDVKKIVRFDSDTESAQSIGDTQMVRDFVNVEIGSNGQLTLNGVTIGSESANVDYFEFIPQDEVLPDDGSPAFRANAVPTAVTFTPTITELAEDADTSEAIKIGDIEIADDGNGENIVTLSGPDSAAFELVGNEVFLKADAAIDFEVTASYAVTINVNDPNVGTGDVDATTSMTLDIVNVNEAPTVSLSPLVTTLAEDADTTAAIAVATITVTDDSVGTNNLTLDGNDADKFEIVGDTLFLKADAELDFEAGSTIDVDVLVDDPEVGEGPSDGSEAFSIALTDVNEAPEVVLSGLVTSLEEGTDTSNAITVATITVQDDALGTNALSLTGDDADLFEIDGTALKLKAGTTLDLNGNPELDVTVVVDDATIGNGGDDSASLSIAIIEDIPTGGNDAALQILGVLDGNFDGIVQGVAVDSTNDGGNVGKVVLTVLDGNETIDASNFKADAFQLRNTGTKEVAAVFIDIRDAVFKDHVFDNDGEGGDRAAKDFQIEGDEGTGAFFVGTNGVVGNPDDNLFFVGATPLADTSGGSNGAPISGGHRGLLIRFDGSEDGFTENETVGFSGDGDPNSIAGFAPSLLKPNNVTSGEFDTGGQSGLELIGSSFTVLFADGTTATGYLGSDTTQAGAVGEAVQGQAAKTASLSIDTGDGVFSDGDSGTYGGDLPEITVTGTPGDIVRVTLIKGFKDTNAEAGGSPDLVAEVIQDRLDVSHPEFAVNNAFDVQTVDVTIKTDGTATVPLTTFDYVNTVSGVSFNGDDVQPLAFTASVIEKVEKAASIIGNGRNDFVPVGPLTDPIYLTNPTETPVNPGSAGTPLEGYFAIEGSGANQYFKIQMEAEGGSGGENPLGKWEFVDAPDGSGNQSGFQGSGYYVFGDSTQKNIDNNISEIELLEYDIFVDQNSLGVYTFSFTVSRDGQFPNDQQNDLWLNLKHAEDPGFGDISTFLTDTGGNTPEPENNGFIKIFGGSNDGAWSTTGKFDGLPSNVDAKIEFTEAGEYTIQIEGRSTGYHIDFFELYKGNNPGGGAANSDFIEANNGPALAPDVTTLRSSIDASSDDFTGLGGAGEDELSFGDDLGQSNTVGLRFDDITIPQGATILEAYLQFEAAENGTDAADFTIALEDTITAETYSAGNGPADRDYLSDEFVWTNVETWDAGDIYQSPDFAALIDELIATNGNLDDAALAFSVEGTGSRVANAFDGDGNAPQLVIVFDENDSLL